MINENKKNDRAAQKAIVKYDPLQSYMMEISNYNLLSREKE